MADIKGIMIDFRDERPYYYQVNNPDEAKALHKIYALLVGICDSQSSITSIAIAAGDNNDDAYHIHHGKVGVLLEALGEILATLLSRTEKPEVIESLFIDAMHESLLDKLKDPLK